MNITFGDNVKVLSSPETDAISISGKVGQVSGETTPSVTGVEVIGEVNDDFALNVSIEGYDETYWLSTDLLEFIDHAEGTEMVVGNVRAVRRADGCWEESYINPPKKWWQFWK
jgi:hypothetical protein